MFGSCVSLPLQPGNVGAVELASRGNKDLEPFLPAVVDAASSIDKTHNCVEKRPGSGSQTGRNWNLVSYQLGLVSYSKCISKYASCKSY